MSYLSYFSILKGDMSFVGPRPALFNQEDLISLRLESGVNELIPGLTGWAQINGRDNIPIERKAEFDLEYLKKRSLFFDIKIIFLTVFNILASKDISH
jgi:Sugar transferases involved in lipopolysaccharide synthesis